MRRMARGGPQEFGLWARVLLLGLCLLAAWLPVGGALGAENGTAAVREELESLPPGEQLSDQRASILGAQVLAAAEGATKNGAFFSAMTLAADLQEVTSEASFRSIRKEALGLFGRRFVDAVRWASLIQRFQPSVESGTAESWAQDVEGFQELLDGLAKSTSDERVQAHWLYSKAAPAIRMNQQRDWLSTAERNRAIDLLEDLGRRYGALELPGARGDRRRTYADLAAEGLYELRTLHFGAPAPPTSGSDLEGRPLDLEAYRGSVVVLDFWTTFCLPCLAMVPHSRALLEELEGEPFVFLGINGDQDRSQGQRTVDRVGMTWRNFWDGPKGTAGPVATTWRVQGRPTLIVLDAEGRIRHKYLGQQEAEEGLAGVVRNLLAELKTERAAADSAAEKGGDPAP